MGKLLDELRRSSCGKLSVDGAAGKFVAVSYDPKVSGEAARRPAIRQPPFRKEHYSKLIKMVLGARLMETLRSRTPTSFSMAARMGSTASSSGLSVAWARP